MSSKLQINSPLSVETSDLIESEFVYQTTEIFRQPNGKILATPVDKNYTFRLQKNVPKTGVMMVGWGGNNGTTLTGAILANKYGLEWETKDGRRRADFFGSVFMSGTLFLGYEKNAEGLKESHVPWKDLVPLLDPTKMVLGKTRKNSSKFQVPKICVGYLKSRIFEKFIFSLFFNLFGLKESFQFSERRLLRFDFN